MKVSPQETKEKRLDRLEEGLRDVIDETLHELAGVKYWKQLVPRATRIAVSVRMDKQAALHPRAVGRESVTHRTRLNYCDFSDYQQIVSQRNTWPAFELIFLRRSEFERHIISARRFRNALKHLRDLEPVERLAGHAAILWLEKAIGLTRFSNRVIAEDQATVEDCQRVLERRKVPEGQRQLIHALVEAGPPGLTGEELVQTMGRRDFFDLSFVLGALGNRVNRTPGYGECKTPGIGMLLDITEIGEDCRYSLKPIMLEALRQSVPVWLSLDDIDVAIAAHGTPNEGLPNRKAFREACARRVESVLDCKLTRQSSALFWSHDHSTAILCLVSRVYKSPTRVRYWFGFYPSQKDRLEEAVRGYLALGCGSPYSVLLIPIEQFASLLPEANKTVRDEGRFYWHVDIHREPGRLILDRRQGSRPVDLSQYLI